MKNFISISILLFIVSCASSPYKDKIDLESVSNNDFKKEKAVPYVASRDYFKSVESKFSDALNDETIQRVDNLGGDVNSNDVISEIISNCYEEDFDKATLLIKTNQEAYRSNPSFWNQVGTCYLLQKSKRKALLFYNKSLEFDTNYAPALNNLGVLYRKFGEDQKAEVAFKRAIKGNNFAKTPRFNLAHLYLSYGLFNQALKELRVLEKVSKDDVDVQVGLATAYLMKGDSKQALKYYKKISSTFYERPYIGISTSLAHYLNGDLELAKDILSDVEESELRGLKNYYKNVKAKVLK